MSRGWIPPAAVENHDERVVIYADGSARRDVDVTWDEAAYRRQRTGYQCPWCFQLLETAFERTCASWCHGGPSVTEEEWQAYMDAEFEGTKWLGLTREQYDRAETPTSELAKEAGIWTPPGA